MISLESKLVQDDGVVCEGQIMVVPPLECAWLAGEDCRLQSDEEGYILFEAKGKILKCDEISYLIRTAHVQKAFPAPGRNDATVILKKEYGSRRWQDINGDGVPEENYTIIVGSHRNSCIKVEKNGMLQCVVTSCPQVKLSPDLFGHFWIYYCNGEIKIGYGYPSEDSCCCSWKDAGPPVDVQFIGLSSWDSHVGYRNVRIIKGSCTAPHVSDTWDDEDLYDVNFGDTREGDGFPGLKHTDLVPVTEGGFMQEDSVGCKSLMDMCVHSIEDKMSISNVCHVLTVLEGFMSDDFGSLWKLAIEYAARNLETVSKCPDFCTLSASVLAEIVQHQKVSCSEKHIFDTVLLWGGFIEAFASAGPPTPGKRWITRKHNQGGDAILPHIRFPLMSKYELDYVKQSDLYMRSHVLQNLVEEADQFHDMPEMLLDLKQPSVRVNGAIRSTMLSHDVARRRQHRCPDGCTPLVYMYDGDTNGACYYIATNYGKQSWVNPVAAGVMSVRASSPMSRCGTDGKSLVSRNFSRLNFAGPKRTQDDYLESWWTIDLGEEHRLRCTRYIIRHDGSSDYLRTWCLLGSIDGLNWMTLSTHQNDVSLKISGQYASWPVRSRPERFRFFKLLQTQANVDGPNPWHVSLSYIDFYGDFFRNTMSQ
eukprot:jgi/Picsp_1/2571/NSC_00802-R1_btb poz domain-containing protein